MAVAVKPDPRCEPGAYLTRSGRLYENVGPERDDDDRPTGLILLEDCGNLHRHAASVDEVITWYDLVRHAPACPDLPPVA